MIEVQQNPIYGLVKLLNKEGMKVVEIDNEYFVTSDFQAADRNTSYHIVKGKHINCSIIVTALFC